MLLELLSSQIYAYWSGRPVKDKKLPAWIIPERQVFLIHQSFTKYTLQKYSGLNYVGLYVSSAFVESGFVV